MNLATGIDLAPGRRSGNPRVASIRPSGPNALAHPLRARIHVCLAGSNLHPPRILGTLIAEQKAFDNRTAECQAANSELTAAITAMRDRARAEDWSQRELARRAGLGWSEWRRLRDLKIPIARALQRIRTALEILKLQPMAATPETELL